MHKPNSIFDAAKTILNERSQRLRYEPGFLTINDLVKELKKYPGTTKISGEETSLANPYEVTLRKVKGDDGYEIMIGVGEPGKY
jgi:hypothetical protein